MADNREALILQFKEESQDIRKALGALIGRLADAEKGLGDLEKKAKSAGEKMASAMVGASRKIQGAFTGMAGKVTALLGVGGILASFNRAVQGAKDFEASLAEVSTLIGGDATAQVAKYRGEIEKLSRETGRSVTELSSGLYQVISAGTKGTESVEGSMKLLDVATKAAIGGISDTFSAVDLLTTSLNAYNKTTADAADFSDILFTTVKMGKTNFNQLAMGMGMVASTAANAGVKFEELNGAFAELTKAGMLPARAFTALQAVIRTLTNPTKELIALVKQETGGTIEQALRTKGLIGVMEILNKKTKGNAFAIKQYVKEQEAANAVNILAGTGLEEFGRIMDKMKERTGAATEAYDKMARSFQEKSARFWNQIELVFIRIGNEVLPILSKQLDSFAKWLDGNSDRIVDFFVGVAEWVERIVTFVIEWAPAAAKALGLVWAVGKILEWNSAVKKATAAVKAFAAANALGGLSGIMGKVKGAWNALSVALAANPFIAITAAVVGLVAAISQLIQYWDELAATMKHDLGGGRQIAIVEQNLMRALRKMSPDQQNRMLQKLLRGSEGALGKHASADVKAMAVRLRERLALENVANEAAMGPEAPLPGPSFGTGGFAEGFTAGGTTKGGVGAGGEMTDAEKKAWKKRQDALVKQYQQEDKLYDQQNAQKEADEKKRFAESLRMQERNAREAKEEFERQMKEGFEETFQDPNNPWKQATDEAGRQLRESLDENLQVWRDRAIDALTGIALTIASELDSLFGGIYRKAYDQVKQLISQGIEAAAEGEKQLILTDADRARIEREMGQPLTADEARARATAMTPAQLAELERQGRIGPYQVVGTETPEDRMVEILATMQEWWENLADNLGPILDWLTNTAVPQLIEKIASSAPAIIETLNRSWVEALPKIAEMIGQYIGQVFDQIPGITKALVEGVVGFVEALMTQLPEIVAALLSSMTDMTTTLVNVVLKLIISGIPDIVAEIIKAVPAIVGEIVTELMVRLIPEMVKAIADAIGEALTGGPVKGKGKKGAAANLGIAIATGGASLLFHEGGVVEAVRAHQGLYVNERLGSDEVPAILQTKERVLSRKEYADMGGERGVQAAMGGGVTLSPVFNIGNLWSHDTQAVMDKLLYSLLRSGDGMLFRKLGATPGFKPRRS